MHLFRKSHQQSKVGPGLSIEIRNVRVANAPKTSSKSDKDELYLQIMLPELCSKTLKTKPKRRMALAWTDPLSVPFDTGAPVPPSPSITVVLLTHNRFGKDEQLCHFVVPLQGMLAGVPAILTVPAAAAASSSGGLLDSGSPELEIEIFSNTFGRDLGEYVVSLEGKSRKEIEAQERNASATLAVVLEEIGVAASESRQRSSLVAQEAHSRTEVVAGWNKSLLAVVIFEHQLLERQEIEDAEDDDWWDTVCFTEIEKREALAREIFLDRVESNEWQMLQSACSMERATTTTTAAAVADDHPEASARSSSSKSNSRSSSQSSSSSSSSSLSSSSSEHSPVSDGDGQLEYGDTADVSGDGNEAEDRQPGDLMEDAGHKDTETTDGAIGNANDDEQSNLQREELAARNSIETEERALRCKEHCWFFGENIVLEEAAEWAEILQASIAGVASDTSHAASEAMPLSGDEVLNESDQLPPTSLAVSPPVVSDSGTLDPSGSLGDELASEEVARMEALAILAAAVCENESTERRSVELSTFLEIDELLESFKIGMLELEERQRHEQTIHAEWSQLWRERQLRNIELERLPRLVIMELESRAWVFVVELANVQRLRLWDLAAEASWRAEIEAEYDAPLEDWWHIHLLGEEELIARRLIEDEREDELIPLRDQAAQERPMVIKLRFCHHPWVPSASLSSTWSPLSCLTAVPVKKGPLLPPEPRSRARARLTAAATLSKSYSAPSSRFLSPLPASPVQCKSLVVTSPPALSSSPTLPSSPISSPVNPKKKKLVKAAVYHQSSIRTPVAHLWKMKQAGEQMRMQT
eukprot:NODE_239_length_2623_cov_20.743590_g217_i0.p1 GENE.NODE_239_length_2623_cov_20.743590_g217_i0~~NODE_239_length_2623_cov_20.743590_g217_i0.p1  ORF type:complete len:814 (+),score=186.92 NODE_239_length_2623_cov_20.743590_g217_i0:125-2566(+)